MAYDADNPEWTENDFARAKPASAIKGAGAKLLTRAPGRPKGSTDPNAKVKVTIRLDQDVLRRLKSGGQGWQTRLNDTLRGALALD